MSCRKLAKKHPPQVMTKILTFTLIYMYFIMQINRLSLRKLHKNNLCDKAEIKHTDHASTVLSLQTQRKLKDKKKNTKSSDIYAMKSVAWTFDLLV